jgi:DMSO/TMAO reductase YedYZ molybdopterin-dependent catalytic subunit
MNKKQHAILIVLLCGLILSLAINAPVTSLATEPNEASDLGEVEIREYDGENLSSVYAFPDNSISGPQYLDAETYRLAVTGMVDDAQDYTYEEVISGHQIYRKLVTLYCVEGWKATILWEGVLVKDLIADAQVDPNATVVIFYAYDGYSTSLPLDYIIDNNILLAHKMNNVTLPPERGYPFELVAESQWGYKWIKWVNSIVLSDNEAFLGYWESRGYPNDADLGNYTETYDFVDIGGDPTIPELNHLALILLVSGTVLLTLKLAYQKKARKTKNNSF